ncbi:gamma-taxilin-like isoform X3 [Artibeus jamaicensis]|uniref:gamma-taxilin-like isoform X3 n=1 Tax=Artibeus jamaicensis TaxID=9417 RepID=UPI00235AF434|nr:gamma-taxilin-like isoform X3 [Artibeus jamaicensis]
MEESRICRQGVKAVMLHNCQSNSIRQHQDSNCGGTSNKYSLDKDEGSDFIIKNSNLMNPLFCTQESREKPPRLDAGTDHSDSPQDSECNRNKGKTLGKEVLLLMQALNTLSTPEEKLAALCKKYADLLEESWNVQTQMKILQKKQAQIVKEKVHLQSEHSKAVSARSKLESLCRELQRYNKTLKEENMEQAREEEESREKATSHFQLTLNEIQAQLEQHDIQNAKLRQENTELGGKLKKLIEQYTLREKHIDKVFKRKELQQHLVDVKLQQITQLIREADEKHQREREFLLKEATESRYKYEEMKHQEVQLKQQMTKKIKKLEREMIIWRTKWESNNKVLLQMAEEKTICDKEYKSSQMKLERLEKLFRALQVERNDLSQKVEALKEQGPVKAADVALATPGIQPCATVASQKDWNPSCKGAPGICSQDETKGGNETKGSSKDPFHMISSGH